jgi:16S rRNA (cytosine1402-N4)-methyltransferase
MSSYHTPVLLKEAVEALAVKPDGVYVDGTLGGGGHFTAVLDRLDDRGTAIGLDRDPQAVDWVRGHLPALRSKVIIQQRRFSETASVLKEQGVGVADGILLDLGVSSHQIDAGERGFMYREDADLDMRMDPSTGRTARELLMAEDTETLAKILREYGEVGNSLRMAQAIVTWHEGHDLRTSADLRKCLAHEYGSELQPKVLSKVFQALRIAVNQELGELEAFLSSSADCLSKGGRLVIIAYHSLEDRLVKTFMRQQEGVCTCPPEFPVCVCGKQVVLKRINHKAVKPSVEEIAANPRARSARLRAAERC